MNAMTQKATASVSRPLPKGSVAASQVPTSGCVARGMMRFGGVVVSLAAVGIWLVPGAVWDGEQVLVKLAISVFFACCGMALLQTGRDQGVDEFHVDRNAGELRHVLRGCDGIARVQESYALAGIEAVQIEDNLMTVMGREGVPLLRLPLRSVETARALEIALEQGGVKLG